MLVTGQILYKIGTNGVGLCKGGNGPPGSSQANKSELWLCHVCSNFPKYNMHLIIYTFLKRLLYSTTIKSMGGSPGDVSEEPVTQEKRKKGWRMSCDVGEATEGLENEL